MPHIRFACNSFAAIGEALGISGQACHKLYKAALHEIPEPLVREERLASRARVDLGLQKLNDMLNELRGQELTPETADVITRIVPGQVTVRAAHRDAVWLGRAEGESRSDRDKPHQRERTHATR